MPTTVPDGIVTPDVGWTGGFVQAMITMADTIQAIFLKRGAETYSWADATARGVQAGMTEGAIGLQRDIAIQWRFDGTNWNPYGTSSAATAAARDTKIPGAQRKQGMRVAVRDTGIIWQYYELYNVSTNPNGATPAGWYPVDDTGPFGVVSRNVGAPMTLTLNTYNILTNVYTDVEMRGGVTSPTSASAGKFTVPLDGWYQVDFHWYTPSPGANSFAMVKKNSVANDATGNVLAGSGVAVNNADFGSVSGLVRLAANDYLAMAIYTSATTTLGVTSPETVGWSVRFVKPVQAA